MVGPFSRGIDAVSGTWLAMSASFASGVPGMDERTLALGLALEMRAKSGGSGLAAMNRQGPSSDRASNHRPDKRTKYRFAPPSPWTKISSDVFVRYHRSVPPSG